MVVHKDWKYIGEGMEYAAYLVRDHVVKVPKAYFNDRYSRGDSWTAIREADFDLGHVFTEKINAWVAYGKQQVENSKYYGEFGVPTYVDVYGLVHQQYVVGREPTIAEEKEFIKFIRAKGMLPGDLYNGNFRITPLGPKIFDYGNSPLRRKHKG